MAAFGRFLPARFDWTFTILHLQDSAIDMSIKRLGPAMYIEGVSGLMVAVGLNDQINDAKNMMGSDRLNGSHKNELSVGWQWVGMSFGKSTDGVDQRTRLGSIS